MMAFAMGAQTLALADEIEAGRRMRLASFGDIRRAVQSHARSTLAQLETLGRRRQERAHATTMQRQSHEQGRLGDHARDQAHRRQQHKRIASDVSAIATSTRDGLAQARHAWGRLAAGGPRTDRTPASDPAAAADPGATAERKNRRRVLALIHGHPEGIRLAEMEAALELSRGQLAPICKALLFERQVTREGGTYFPQR